MRVLLAAVAAALAVAWAAPGPTAEAPPRAGRSHALIVVGLPGDDDHEKLFADVARRWHTWLTGSLGFAPADVRVLFGRAGRPGLARGPADRAAVRREVAEVRKALRPEDRLWVFLLGHGDHDGEHAYFHLPGPDLRATEMRDLFAGIDCREQVFWLTMPASGWFLRPLSARGRIVITATAADEEYNETEFPQALAAVAARPPEKLDSDRDGRVSVLEIYRHTVAEVGARFAADDRVPTEHAQLDDNGDGASTEEPVLAGEKDKRPTADGALAGRTYLPLKSDPRK